MLSVILQQSAWSNFIEAKPYSFHPRLRKAEAYNSIN